MQSLNSLKRLDKVFANPAWSLIAALVPIFACMVTASPTPLLPSPM